LVATVIVAPAAGARMRGTPASMPPVSVRLPAVAPIVEPAASVIAPESVLLPLILSMAPARGAAPLPLMVAAFDWGMPPWTPQVPPELTVTAPEPKALLLAAISVPALIVVAPVQELEEPESVWVPVPFFTRLRVPALSKNVPAYVAPPP